MENPIATRLIEYPSDLSECNSLRLGDKQLLYLCSKTQHGSAFIVILGFFSCQKEDIVTKDLIEPVKKDDRNQVENAVRLSVNAFYSTGSLFFL